MIDIFITDIDGCLMDPMQIPDWDLLSEIRALNEQSKYDPSIPPLTLCTGRPLTYAEAVAQMMGISQPFVFENAGIFDPIAYKIHLNGTLTDDNRKKINDLRGWLEKNILNKYKGFSLEFSKIMDAGLVHPNEEMIQRVLPAIQKYIGKNHKDIEIHSTSVSVNIIFTKNNKKSGIEKLCRWKSITPSNAAFIGDSSGDIPGLEIIGHPFAPENAANNVKKAARTLPFKSTRAVLQAYREVITQNRA